MCAAQPDSSDGLKAPSIALENLEGIQIALPADQIAQASERLSAPDSMEFYEDRIEIEGVHNFVRIVSCVPRRIDGEPVPLSIGGARIATKARLLETLKQTLDTKKKYARERQAANISGRTGIDITHLSDLPLEEQERRLTDAAIRLEARELADEMTRKWLGYYLIMQMYPDFYAQMAAEGHDNWLDTALRVQGHKTVIETTDEGALENLNPQQRDQLVRAIQKHANRVNGISENQDSTKRGGMQLAPDMGTGNLMNEIAQYTRNVVCSTRPDLGGYGDPSPFTAEGVFQGILGALKAEGIDGHQARFFIQGVLGAVGSKLFKRLIEAFPDAEFVVSDMDHQRFPRLENFADEWNRIIPGRVIPRSQRRLFTIDNTYDMQRPGVLVLCAGPAELTKQKISALKDAGICLEAGAANYLWPVGESGVAEAYEEAGIHVVPPYLINPGGIASTICELMGDKRPSPEELYASLVAIQFMIQNLMVQAKREGVTPEALAERRVVEEYARRLALAGRL